MRGVEQRGGLLWGWGVWLRLWGWGWGSLLGCETMGDGDLRCLFPMTVGWRLFLYHDVYGHISGIS